MSAYEVPEPILNSPFEEPQQHWHLVPDEEPRKEPGRRPAMYFYRPPTAENGSAPGGIVGTAIELKLVNRIRERVKAWRESAADPYAGVTRTTRELLEWWRREGRQSFASKGSRLCT